MLKNLLSWRPSRRWMIAPPVLIGIACIVGFAMSRKELPRLEPIELAVSIPVIRVQPSAVPLWATGFGTATPARTWAAISEVKGRVVETLPQLNSGKRVGKNELLLRIDDSDYQLRLDQRRSDLDSAKAKLEEIKAASVADKASLGLANRLLEVANADLKRMRGLEKNKAVSDSEVDTALRNVLQQSQSAQSLKNSLTLFPSKIASAKASIAMAESQVKEAIRDVERTAIVSPFDGVLSGVSLEPGQIVAQNQRLFEVQDDQVVEIEAQFSLAQLEKISPRLRSQICEQTSNSFLDATDTNLLASLTAEVILHSGDITHRWLGQAIRISESLDEQTRTLGIVIQVNNLAVDSLPTRHDGTGLTSAENTLDRVPRNPRTATLRSGSFCEVNLYGQSLSDAITIPRTALDGNVIYVVDENSRLWPRSIEIGFAIGEQVTVVEGLTAGDLVAATYPVPAIDGQLVDPRYIDLVTIDSITESAIVAPDRERSR